MEIQANGADILKLGEHNKLINCFFALDGASLIYMAKFYEKQLKIKTNPWGGRIKMYGQVKNSKDVLIKNYIIPLSEQFHNVSRVSDLEIELRGFLSKFPPNLVEDLISTIHCESQDKSKKLEFLTNIIDAIHKEKYEDAAANQKKIEELSPFL